MYEFTTICEIFSNLSLFFILNFVKIEFQKGGRLLNIYQTVVDYKIFSKKVVFGHFGHSLAEIGGRRFNCIKKKGKS